MADTKITALTAITTVDPANDVLPIVDVSDTSMAASGTTKKITTNQILGASGTATLASATITGNLTVQSNVNAPASVSFRYGPSAATWAGLRFDSTNQTFLDSDIALIFRTGGATSFTTAYTIGATGISTWSVGGSTAMTLNSTGLGVGGSPATKIFANVTPPGAGQDGVRVSDGTRLIQMSISGSTYSYQGIGANQNVIYASGNPLSILSDAQNLRLGTSSTSYLLLDTSGNVGIGVTPKSWLSSYKAIQLGYSTSLSSTTGTDFAGLSSNAYVDSVDSRWERIVSGYATQYYQNAGDGQHIWRIAGTAAADTAITWTNAMTLDASGNLLVGLTGGNNRVQIAGNIGLPNSCTASGETSGVFSIDVANLLTLNGANWRQASILLVYTGVDTNLGNSTVLQTVVNLQGLSTWNTISKNDIVGTASVAVSNDTTTGARITVTVPAGNSGTAYAVLLGGAGASTRPSMTINP